MKNLLPLQPIMTNYQTATLNSGLRIIYLPTDSQVVYCGICIQAGSRQEGLGEAGLAHFCEHVTFKGTKRRSALKILNCLERLGGDLNAFTNKEDTTFYATVLNEHFSTAVDLLTDIVFNSQYPAQELEHEKDVICDEIESYNDSPAELIYDEFENMLFQGHPLGHHILGTREQVLAFTPEDACRFTQKHYRPDNAVFFVYGKVDFNRLVRQLEMLVPVRELSDSQQPATDTPLIQPAAPHAESQHHQAHVMLGSKAYAWTDERRMPLYLLNNILGGPAMNARLNLSLRERNGLVYTVESSMVSYSDTGCWSVYFGCDHHDVKRCLRLVHMELDRLMQKPLREGSLNAAKQQLKGQLTIACDNREQFALDFGRHFLLSGEQRDIAKLLQRIDDITADQMQTVAQEVFAPDRLQLLTL